MAKTKPTHFFRDDLNSEEFVYIAFSMLESRGYHGLIELMSAIDDPSVIMRFLYLFSGMTIKIPTTEEFADSLRASVLAYCRLAGNVMQKKGISKDQTIQATLNVDDDEFEKLNNIYQDWIVKMEKNGYSIQDYMTIKNPTELTKIRKLQGKKKQKTPPKTFSTWKLYATKKDLKLRAQKELARKKLKLKLKKQKMKRNEPR